MMMKNSRRGRYDVFLLGLLFMSLTAPLSAGGRTDFKQDSMPHPEFERVSKLIKEGQLDEAMSILVEIGKAYPNQIELVQKFVLEIRSIEDEITGLLEEIKNVLASEALSLDQKAVKTEETIQQIKMKDRNPTSDTWQKIAIVESLFRRTLDLLRREIFFARGNEKIKQGLYREAIYEYEQGFIDDVFGESQTYEKYRDAVQPSDIEVISSLPNRNLTIFEAYKRYAPEGDKIISELTSLIDRWSQISSNLSSNVAVASTVISRDNLANWSEFDLVALLNLEYQEARTILSLGYRLGETMNQLHENLDRIPEDFRYDRVISFLNGRTGRDEGIAYAQRLQWESSFLKILTTMLDVVSSTYFEGISNYQSRLWTESADLFSLSGVNTEHVLEFTALANNYLASLADSENSEFASQLRSIFLELQTIAEASKIRIVLIEITSGLPSFGSESLPDVDIESVQILSEMVWDSTNQIENLLFDWNQYSDQIAGSGEIVNASVWRIVNDLQVELLELLKSLSSEKSSAFLQYFDPRYRILDSKFKDLIQESDTKTVSANNLLDEDKPKAAIELLIAPFLVSIEAFSGDIDDFFLTVTKTLEITLDDEVEQDLAEYDDKTNALLVGIAQLKDQWLAIQASAIARQNAALRAETIALATLSEAEGLLEAAREADIQGQADNNINDFYRAKDSYISLVVTLARAHDLFSEIENNDMDIAVDSGIKERLAELERIAYNEPRQLAVTVRDYAIAEADNKFSERLFDDGLDLLLLAQQFWVSTFGEEDTRLRLRIVRFRTAQHSSLKTRIEPSDPLFGEMNQYLNLANQRYQEGISQLETDTANQRNTNALKSFSDAEDLVQEVLNVFSGNSAALLLQKKILKIKQPDKYTETVRELIENANAAVRNGNSEVLITGIGFNPPLDPQLRAVFEFDPDFPGLKSAIERVDIYLGRIILLPTEAEIEESVRITESVRSDWTQTLNLTTDAIATASPDLIERLNTALQLWENNIDAANLQDEIRFYTQPRALPDNLRNLIAVADEQRHLNNKSSVETIYRSIINTFPVFIRHPEVMKIKYWLDIE